MAALCATRPAEWWETGDPGNRLALALCRVCPRLASCATGDPKPHGVVLAGQAYDEHGRPLALCRDCGYPLCRSGGCRWCGLAALPGLSAWGRHAARRCRKRTPAVTAPAGKVVD